MNQAASVERFSLLGGPLHGLGRRLGLVRGDANTVRLGLALGPGFWLVLVVLAAIEGFARPGPSLSLIGAHIRLLVVIPLFFLAETWVGPRTTAFVDLIVRSAVVPGIALPSLNREISKNLRWKDSWIPEALCLAGAVASSLSGPHLALPGATAAFDPGRAPAEISLVGRWYFWVCMPLFHFLALRWALRLLQWWRFLAGIARLDLHLVPTHPDGAAGLGYLEVVQTHFLPMVFAISALLAASFAEDYVAGVTAFETMYPLVALAVVVNLLLFVGPTFAFAPRLWACRVKALSEYMEFASGYVMGFERKWLGAGGPPKEALLGTPDLQSLADLGNSMDVVRNMHLVPASLLVVRDIAFVALLPVLPLLLLKYHIAELAQKLFARLAGL